MTFDDVTWPGPDGHDRCHPWYSLLLQRVVKNESLDFSSLMIEWGRSRNWPEHRSSIYKFRDKQVEGFYGLITSCNFQSVRSYSLPLTRSQSCKKVIWGRVIQADLVTRPSKVESHYLHIKCKEVEGIVMSNIAARSAAGFPLSTKILRGVGGKRISAHPVGARVSFNENNYIFKIQ